MTIVMDNFNAKVRKDKSGNISCGLIRANKWFGEKLRIIVIKKI